MVGDVGIKVVIRYVRYADGIEIGPKTEFEPAYGSSYEHTAEDTVLHKGKKWGFSFWTLEEYSRSRLIQGKKIKNQAYNSQTASAWYLPIGSSPKPGTQFTPMIFSSASNKFLLNETPIESVSPKSALAANKKTVYCKTNVEITPKNSIKTNLYECFDNWFMPNKGALSGKVLKVPKGGCPLAIAFYSPPPGSDPAPFVIWLEHFTKVIRDYGPPRVREYPPFPPPPPPVKKNLGLIGEYWRPEWQISEEVDDEGRRKKGKRLR